MDYPLYTYYKHSFLDLYQLREHYTEHFYMKRYGKEKAVKILKVVVASTIVDTLLLESYQKKVVPSYEDFLSTICSMWKFMFQSNETIILASIDAALRWDIEVNSKLQLTSPKELKEEMIKVFDKFSIYEELTDAEYAKIVTASFIEEVPKKFEGDKTTWTFVAFTKEFGEDVSVSRFHRKDDGEIFYSCVFTNDMGHKTFVGFSSKLGVLTAEEISIMKDKLIVIKNSSGHYNLYEANNGYREKVKL